jgi:hypothetical protein
VKEREREREREKVCERKSLSLARAQRVVSAIYTFIYGC